MSIPGIKEIDFEQAYLNKSIPKGGSHEKYIAKDFILELGGVKIKLKASDSLRDVIRKINLQSHVTGVRGKAVKGRLALESTTKGRGQPSGITLPKKDSGEGVPVNANQIIANYLASLPPKISIGIQVWDEAEHNLYLLNELPQLALDEESEHSDGLGDEELHVNDFDVDNNSHDHQSIHDSDHSDHEEIGNNPIENQIINAPQLFMQQIILPNLSPNVSPVHLGNHDKYIEKLMQADRHKLELLINKKLLTFHKKYPLKNIVSKNAVLKDKLVFCLKEIKNKRMSSFPRTDNL